MKWIKRAVFVILLLLSVGFIIYPTTEDKKLDPENKLLLFVGIAIATCLAGSVIEIKE